MNVAIIASGLAYEAGAIPVRARLEAEALIKNNHRVMGFGRYTKAFPSIDLPFPYKEIQPIILPRPLASISMRFSYEYRLACTLIKENNIQPFDLVIEHEQGYGVTRRRCKKKIEAKWISLVQRTIYDTMSSGRCPFNPIHARFLLFGSNFELSHSDAIVTLHEEMTAEILAYCPNTPITKSIPNGIPNPTKSFDEIHSIRENKIILFAGRLSIEKCVDVLIRAFAQIEPSDCELRIAGDTPGERQKLEKLVESLGIKNKVCFLGALPHCEVLKEMKKAALFVLPSASEGLPFVLLEALSSGLPIIASDIPGNRAIIRSGVGMLTPVGDELALARAISTLLQDKELRYSIAREGFQHVKQFSWTLVMNQSLKFYETIGMN